MSRFAFALMAILMSASFAQSQGIAARSTAETLRGLRGVHVVVSEVVPDVRSAGLTAGAIKSAVEARLIDRGVPVLGLGELTMDPRGPSLLIQMDFVVSPPVYFYNSQVQFFQNVTVDMGADEIPSYASASTWQTSKVDKAGKFRLPTLTQVVVGQVDGFIDAYLGMNVQAEEEEMEGADPEGEEMQEVPPEGEGVLEESQ